jgi:hypothetical protein
MRSAAEPGAAAWRRPAKSRYRITKAALTVAMGLLLTAGFATAPAQAAVSTAKAAIPATLKSCPSGVNNSYEYYVWCDGTGPTSYRAIAYCANGSGVFGIERWDGDRRQSYANCQIDGMNSTLNGDWGIILCSTDNGTGTFQGYLNRQGDISWILLNWGNGNIVTGGNTMCEYNTSGAASFNPNQAP